MFAYDIIIDWVIEMHRSESKIFFKNYSKSVYNSHSQDVSLGFNLYNNWKIL